jgi:hypothetical protein
MLLAWRVNVYLTVLNWPAPQLKTFFVTRRYVKGLLRSPRTRRWTPETIAVVAMATMMRDVISKRCTPGDRARTIEHLNASKMDLVDELNWINGVRSGEAKASSMSPLEFRITWTSALAARWLIDKQIDMQTKALFSEVIANALAETPEREINAMVSERIAAIGAPRTRDYSR